MKHDFFRPITFHLCIHAKIVYEAMWSVKHVEKLFTLGRYTLFWFLITLHIPIVLSIYVYSNGFYSCWCKKVFANYKMFLKWIAKVICSRC